MSLRDKFGELRDTWQVLLASALWLSGTVGSFLTFPVQLSLDSSSDLEVKALAQFAGAAVAGVFYAARWNTRAGARLSDLRVVMGLLVAAIGLFAVYFFLSRLWTCLFAARFRLVIGATLTPAALAYVTLNPSDSCAALIGAFAGDTERIYSKAELIARFVFLALVYVSSWLASAAVILSVAWALRPSLTTNSPDGPA